MDNHELFELALAVLNLGLGALGYVLWQSLRDVRADAKKSADAATSLELYCARTYVTQDGMTKAINDLKETITGLVAEIKQSNEDAKQNFRDVFSKLNDKMDKH